MSSKARGVRSSIALACLIQASCSVVPDWSRPESREFDIIAHYDASDLSRAVRLPTSSENVQILFLRAEPADLVQTWHAGDRRLMLPPKQRAVRVHCRYRLFREPRDDGQRRPWPDPAQLFPGADYVRTRGNDEPR